jgi:hypothetical protein
MGAMLVAAMEHKERRRGYPQQREEEIKGNEVVKAAAELLRNRPNFIGNVEGDGIYQGEPTSSSATASSAMSPEDLRRAGADACVIATRRVQRNW